MNVIALVPLGDRDAPQSGALVHVRGEPLLSHAVRGLLRSGSVDRVVVAGPSRHVAAYSSALGTLDAEGPVQVVEGGADRAESVRSALAGVSVEPSDVVLLHDAARAFMPPATIRAVVDTMRAGAQAAVPVEPVTDTIKTVDSRDIVTGTRDRSLLRSTQSPVALLAHVLRAADLADPLAGLDGKVRTVAGHPHGMRLATSFDLAVIEALLTAENHQ